MLCYISSGPKILAQLLVEHAYKTAHQKFQKFIKPRTIYFQRVFNQIVSFQRHWTEM